MIQSVARAFAILELLDSEPSADDGLGAQEIATRMGLKFPTAHNFLKTLVQLGYLERVPGTARYRAAAKLGRLGNSRARLACLEAAARREIQRLADEFRETVSLSVEVDFHRETLAIAESDQELRVVQRHRDEQFYRYPVGRILLCRMATARLEAFVEQRGLPGSDWDGIDSRPKLDAALATIRREGVALKENLQLGAAAIAVPVLALPEDLNAAFCMVLPLTRYSQEKCRRITDALREAATRLAETVDLR